MHDPYIKEKMAEAYKEALKCYKRRKNYSKCADYCEKLHHYFFSIREYDLEEKYFYDMCGYMERIIPDLEYDKDWIAVAGLYERMKNPEKAITYYKKR